MDNPIGILLDLSVNFFLMFVFAGLVEALTEFVFAPLFDNLGWLDKNKWLLPYTPIPLGILGAIMYQFDILYEVSRIAGGTVEVNALGLVLTGVLIARGSNFLHQYTERWFPAKRGL